jgi:Sulfatase/Protein of unknown function (DUF1254)/Protein of unknown function (DUF1214)
MSKQKSAEPAVNGAIGTPSVLPRPDFHFPGAVGRTYLDSDPAQFPKPAQAPKGAPNILLILIDDAGFGQFSTFGGGIPSPTMDRLAAEGLRYNVFHTTALCSPTRAALITGRNHHSAAFAGITEAATGYDGYTCILPRSCGTVGEVLRQNGYMTAWIGKNHNTPTWETSAAGPFGRTDWDSTIFTASMRRHEPLEPDPLPEPGSRSGVYRPELPFVYNYLSLDRPTFAAKEALPKGKTKLVVDFAYDGGGMGKGGKITLSANGVKIAEGRLERTMPIQFSLGEGLDIGRDVTLNSDTPYAPILMDLSDDPMVIELPAGPLICIAMDVNQLWIADLGLPGPAAGKGDKVVFLPPGYEEKPPAGYRVANSRSNTMLVGVRSIPIGGDVAAAIERIKTVKVHPLKPLPGGPETRWLDLTPAPQDTTPLARENNIQFWRELADVITSEPSNPRFHDFYGELAALGIEKSKRFHPDARRTAILEKAAEIGNAQLRVESFGDRRPDRIVWPDRTWEWAALRFEDGDFNTANYGDLYARDKWFYQAIGASPAMFRRDAMAGSLYWLGVRDNTGATLDGGKAYKLSVPQPVPGKLFWSFTVYDTDTRSQVDTDRARRLCGQCSS